MDSDPYARFNCDELILRDYLAADRTVLANERTLLSYVRTAIAFAGAGAALIHFFDSALIEVVGWILLLLSAGMMAVGAQRFMQMKRRLDRIERRAAAKGTAAGA